METQREKLTAIADAIREKDGSTEPIVANDFPDRIRSLPTGGLTEAEADERYLKLAGGELTGPIFVKAGERNSSLEVEGVFFYNKDSAYAAAIAPVLAEDGSFEAFEFGHDRDDGLCRLANIAAPQADTDAANKAYVDQAAKELGGKFLPLTGGTLAGEEGGHIVLNPKVGHIYTNLTDGKSAGLNAFGASLDLADLSGSVTLTPKQLYLDYWSDGSNGADDSFVVQVNPESRALMDNPNIFIPVLRFEDGFAGEPGVILAGVNTPTEDYDAANKKYVDENTAYHTAQGWGLWKATETTYGQMLALLPNFFQALNEAGISGYFTNEIKDPTFTFSMENVGVWTLEGTATGSSSVGLIGNTSLEIPSGEGSASQVISDASKRLVAGHVYWASAYFGPEVGGTNIATVTVTKKIGEMSEELAENRTLISNVTGPWARRGVVFTVPGDDYDEIILTLKFGGTAKSRHIDGAVLLDLTAHWGAGKEPDASWCNANLPFFSGAQTSSNMMRIPKQFATRADIETAIETAVGDISAVLDAINGEVI